MRVDVKPASRARRSRFSLGAALLVAFAVFLIVSLISAVLFVVSPGSNGASASFIQAQSGSIPWNGKDRVNMLVLLTDKASGKTMPTSFTLLSFNPVGRSINMLSIPPNLWVTIPGYGPGKLSESYGDGGAKLSLLMTQTVTHVVIPYYAVVNSDALSQIVDALGGIKISVGHSTTSSTSKTALQGVDGAGSLSFLRQPDPNQQSGVQTMHREQQVFLALSRQLLQPQNFAQIPSLLNSVGSIVETNFPYDQVQSLARLLVSNRSTTHVATLSYSNNAVTKYRQSSQDVLLPDWNQIRSIAQAMAPDPGLASGARVAVLNGTGIQGVALRLADWLRQAQVRVSKVGSASSFNYNTTQVQVGAKASTRARYVASQVAELLQVPVVTANVSKNGAPVVVIIGRDFQDPSQQ